MTVDWGTDLAPFCCSPVGLIWDGEEMVAVLGDAWRLCVAGTGGSSRELFSLAPFLAIVYSCALLIFMHAEFYILWSDGLDLIAVLPALAGLRSLN